MIRTKRIFGLLAAALITVSASATGAATDNAGHPQKLVKSVTEDVLEALRADETADDGVGEHVRALILPHLDFVAMSKLVLGKHWRRADDEQRQAFIEQFRQLLVRTYETSLTKYSNERVEFLPFRESSKPDKLAVVKSEIRRASGPSIPINYRLRYKPEDGWKVYDIAIEGVSLVTNYRSSFSRKISHKGIDQLIRSLKQRNQDPEPPEERQNEEA